MDNLKLTFDTDRFVLQTVAPRPPEGFRRVAQLHQFETKDIKCAVRFRAFADSKAENVFQKLMLKAIALPSAGALLQICPEDLTLYDFQITKGVPFILNKNKSYLAHHPGLGKTAQAICAVNAKPGKTLIICPSFLKTTWAREITKWSIQDFPVIQKVWETSRANEINWSADFVIVSDAMLLKEWVRFELHRGRFKYIYIDEAHRFKTPDASRTIALFGGKNVALQSPGLIYNSEHVCMLSGTPLLSKSIELWPILYAMAPETIDFMPYQDFGFHYGGAVQDGRGHWRFVGSANEADLRQRIMGRFMQRIRKDDVLKDLPDKVRTVVVVDEDPRKPDIKEIDHILLRELRNSNFEKPKSLGKYAVVRHANGMAKVVWAARFVHSILQADEKESLVVYCHHKDVLEGLARELVEYNPMKINGETPMELRTKFEDLFQSGRRRLIVGNISAMNLGLTLTRGTRSIFVEYDWTHPTNEQAEDRLHRIGQKDSVFCQYLVLPDSIDEAILQNAMNSEQVAKKVIG